MLGREDGRAGCFHPRACGSCVIGLHECNGYHPVVNGDGDVDSSGPKCGCGCAAIDDWPSDEAHVAPREGWTPDPDAPGRFVPPPDTVLPDDPGEMY